MANKLENQSVYMMIEVPLKVRESIGRDLKEVTGMNSTEEEILQELKLIIEEIIFDEWEDGRFGGR